MVSQRRMTLIASFMNLAGPDLIIILLIILVLFGAKKLPELAHLGGVLRLREFGSRVPRARTCLIEPTRKRRAAFVRESEKLRETLFERAFHAFGIPNEMANSERSKIFSRIPRGQARNTAVAFILPNTLPDSKRVRIGNVNWLSGLRGCDQSKKTYAKRADAGNIMLG